jgi:AraC-like DNA-binding protein
LEECDDVQEATASTHGILEPERGRTHFELRRLAPSEELADHVERHWIVSWDLGEGGSFTQEILPHPCVNLVGEPGLIAVWGIPVSRSPHRIEGTGVAIGTKFRPGGFAGFIYRPVSELNGRAIPLATLFGPAGGRLERRLAATAGNADRHIEAVEDFLRARLPEPDPRYRLVCAVVREMLIAAPGTTVAELADRHAISPRTLQRLFRDYVGVGPKWVLKRYRMHEAAERIAAGEAEDHAALAADLGYFDQSHFIRDFRSQIGRTPAAYARACAVAAGREPLLAA